MRQRLKFLSWTLVWIAAALSFAKSLNVTWKDRTFVRPGDVYLAGIFPLFERNASTDECSVLHVEHTLLQALAFVDVLRQHDYKLTASRTAPDGNQTDVSLRIGYIIGDDCSGPLGAAHYAVDYLSLKEAVKDCPLITSRPLPQEQWSTFPPVFATVGPVTDSSTAVAAPVTASIGMVHLAPFGGLNCDLPQLEDCSGQGGYEYLFRLASPTKDEPDAIADLLLHFNWTYFALIGAVNDIGSTEMLHAFQEKVNDPSNTIYANFCIAFQTTMTASEGDALAVYRLLRRHRRAKAVVLLTPPEHVKVLMGTIWNELKRTNETLPRIWIGWHKWLEAIDLVFRRPEFSSIMQVVLQVTHGGHYQFRTALLDEMAGRFVTYTQTMNASFIRNLQSASLPPWWCRIIEKQRNCQGICNTTIPMTCADNATVLPRWNNLNVTLGDMVDRLTILATETAYQALNKLFSDFVAKSNTSVVGRELAMDFHKSKFSLMKEAVENVSLNCGDSDRSSTCKVFRQGSHSLAPVYAIFAVLNTNHSGEVGFWKHMRNPHLDMFATEKIRFGKDLYKDNEEAVMTTPTSECTPVCTEGQGKTRDQIETCCYSCEDCDGKEKGDGEKCTRCEEGEAANSNRTECVLLPIRSPISKVSRIILATLSVVILLILVFTSVILFRFRHTAVVRSSDRFLMSLWVVAMILSVVLELLIVTVINVHVCEFQNVLVKLLMVDTVAIVVVKTSRMARIYFAAKKMKGHLHRKWSMMTSAQVAMLCGVLVIALIGELILLQVDPPSKKKIFTEKVTYEVCAESLEASITTDAFVGTLIVIATILAFFTRKLMVSLREARLLLLASFSLAVLWLACRGLYYLAEETGRPLLQSLLVLTHTSILWMWLLAPRLYVLLLRPTRRNTVRQPRETIFLPSFAVPPSALSQVTMTLSEITTTNKTAPEQEKKSQTEHADHPLSGESV